MPDAPIRYDGTLESFFFNQLENAQGSQGRLPTTVEAYLVQLLAAYARRPEVAGRTSAPLALQYLAAREQGPPALREVGDRALYIAGVAPGSLARSAVSVGYVRGIGSAAYREVHARVQRLTVFAELAEHFERATEVVGRAVEGESELDLLALYERWCRTRSSEDATRLQSRGVRLDPEGSELLH